MAKTERMVALELVAVEFKAALEVVEAMVAVEPAPSMAINPA